MTNTTPSPPAADILWQELGIAALALSQASRHIASATGGHPKLRKTLETFISLVVLRHFRAEPPQLLSALVKFGEALLDAAQLITESAAELTEGANDAAVAGREARKAAERTIRVAQRYLQDSSGSDA
jgi:hypothetical protein